MDQPQQETPEQVKARLDQGMPTSDPRHQAYPQYLARMEKVKPYHQRLEELLSQPEQ